MTSISRADFYEKFFSLVYKVVDKNTNEVVPLKVNPVQKDLLDTNSDVVILKARQEGVTTVFEAKYTTDILLKSNLNILIILHRQDDADKCLIRIKKHLQEFEEFLGQPVKKFVDNASNITLSNNSSIQVASSSNLGVGRSQRWDIIHMSEFALYENAKESYNSAGTGATGDKSFIVIESTAKGENFFSQLVREHKDILRFYPASMIYTKEQLAKFQKKFGEQFKENFPETIDEAFISSGQSIFGTLPTKCYVERKPKDDGNLRQYRDLERGENIVIGYDMAFGGEDNTCAVAFSLTKRDVPMIWDYNVSAQLVTPILVDAMNTIFNQTRVYPLIVPEINNGGMYEVAQLVKNKGKFNIFIDKELQEKSQAQLSNANHEMVPYGWRTTGSSKGVIVTNGIIEMTKGITIYDEKLWRQLLNFRRFQKTNNYTYSAPAGEHDDLVMALLIGMFGGKDYKSSIVPVSNFDNQPFDPWGKYL